MEDKISSEASIAYLKTVLGVDSFLLPQSFAGAPATADSQEEHIESVAPAASVISMTGPEDAEFAVVIESAVVNEANLNLLERMIVAMKLSFASTLVLEIQSDATPDDVLPLLTKVPRKAVLVFGTRTGEILSGGKRLPLAQWLAPLPELPVLLTHGLDEIGARPELKKTVWQHLQMAMQKLGE